MLAVADGLGGHTAGHIASRTALEAVDEVLTAERLASEDALELLAEALREANRRIRERADGDRSLHGMGTTGVVAHLSEDDTTVTLAHVGDSRGYLLRDAELHRITEDHVVRGLLGRSLSQALGTEPEVDPEAAEVTLRPGDRVLLCTDGLTDMLDDEDIAATMSDGNGERAACDALVEAALARGGMDNVTVVVAGV